MSRIAGGSLAFALGLSLVTAEIRAQDKPSSPSEQYKAILKESQDRMALTGYFGGLRESGRISFARDRR